MSDNTKIEWASTTWSPITGCTPISEGCANCYAKRMSKRLAGRYGYPKDDPFRVTFHRNRLYQPTKWVKHRMIFVCSMGDLFHINVGFTKFKLIMDVICDPSNSWNHTFLLLTKRPNRMKLFFNKLGWWDQNGDPCFPHVWIGITAETRKRYHERWAILQKIPAAVKFVSVEPMLSHVNIDDFLEKPDWIICGAETGPGKREMKTEWAIDLKNQCVSAGIPFFFKKDSYGNRELDGTLWEQFPT